MDINKIKIRVRKEEGLCKNCGKIKNFYYLSDFSYGEMLILIKDGKDYAYENLLEDKTFKELGEMIKLILGKHNITFGKEKFAECINKLFGLTCDNIDNEVVNTVNCNEKCQDCGHDKFSFKKDLKEASIDIEFPVISHSDWDIHNEKEKVESVENELKRLNYIQ